MSGRDLSDSVVVLGGGLAGMSAAVRLADEGRTVTLIETSRRLGGRATSHEDPETGSLVDNCQHVLLGCCTNLIDLYKRLGVESLIRWDEDLHFFDKRGRHDVLKRNGLAAPLHLASLMRFKTLSLGDRLRISRAMLAMMRLGAKGRLKLDGVTFESWLLGRGQSRSAIDRFWAVIVVSALNEMPDRASAAAAIQVFQEGFLAHRDAYLLGTANVPLRKLYDPAVERIEAAGGGVRFGEAVDRIELDEDAKRVATVVLKSGDRLEAGRVVSALPFDRLMKVLPDGAAGLDDRFARLDRFTHSPILGIHLWFDGQVVPHPHMIYVDSPLQWVFNKGMVGRTGEDGSGSGTGSLQYLHGVVSAARQWVGEPADRIVEMAVAELSDYMGEGVGERLVRGRVIKEKRATFAIEPGLAEARPSAVGAIENLILAGDWTDTGWPATMEGAVRSGYRAAGCVMQDGVETGHIERDLPVAGIVSWLGH